MQRGRQIRVLIADDHAVVREGLKSVLERQSNLKVIAESRDWPETIDRVLRHRPDITLADLHMPATEGPAEALAAIRKRFTAARIIVYTAFCTDEEVYQSLQAGACGYVLKGETGIEDVLTCIRAVLKGQVWVHPQAAARLTERMKARSMTKREQDILQLVVAGKSNKGIGASLGVTEGTVKVHVNHIFKKLGVTTRTAVITKALQHGLVRLPDDTAF